MNTREPARSWRAPDLGGVELFTATISEFAFRPHAHEEFFIALTEDGLATPTYRGDRHVVGAGDLIVLNPEEVHAGGAPADGSWTYRALYPHPDLVRKVVALPEFRPEVVRDPEVVGLLRRFHRLAEVPGSSPLEREACLVEALVLLTGRHAVPPKKPRPAGRERSAVRRCREYLAEHAAEPVTLETLAELAGLSPFHLCRVFRAAAGMPPHAYQTQLRVRRAKSLLRAGLPIAAVATGAGFYDQAHLTRHFKQIVGVPPGRWFGTTSGMSCHEASTSQRLRRTGIRS